MITNAYKRAWLKSYRQRPDVKERERLRNRPSVRANDARKRLLAMAAKLVIATTEDPSASLEARTEARRIFNEALAANAPIENLVGEYNHQE